MEREVEIGRKKIDRSDNELAALGNRLERINAKREKLEGEGGAIPDLEEELRQVRREIEDLQREPHSYLGHSESGEDEGIDSGFGTGVEDGDGWDPRFSYPPMQRNRQHSQTQIQPIGPVSRPSITPIQRPSSSHVHTTSNPTSSSIRSHRHSLEPPFVYQPPSQPQQPLHPTHSHSQSQAQISALIKTPPPRMQPSAATNTTTSPTPSLSGTTLSSRAPPFEPNRGVTHTARTSFPGFPSGAGGSTFQWPIASSSSSAGSKKSSSKWTTTGMWSMDGSK